MEKHGLDLVTSTCAMSCNVMLHNCTRHTPSREAIVHHDTLVVRRLIKAYRRERRDLSKVEPA
jgi:hypothetical protein